MKKVFLTGATGLIGCQALPLLRNLGLEVHACAHRREIPDRLVSLATWHDLDLLDGSEVRKTIRRIAPDHLMHLAWAAAPGTTNDPVHDRWFQAGKELLHSFYDQGGERAVVAGTCFEYDWSDGICSETTTALQPGTRYGRCKDNLRQFLSSFCEARNLSWAWGRVFFVYGPGEHPARFVPSVILNLLNRTPAPCTHCRQVRDYMHSRDVADGLIHLLRSNVIGSCNIGSGNGVTLREIAETIATQLHGDHLLRFGAKPAPAGEPPTIVADVRRLRDEVGWQQRISLAQGIEETIAFWQNHHTEINAK